MKKLYVILLIFLTSCQSGILDEEISVFIALKELDSSIERSFFPEEDSAVSSILINGSGPYERSFEKIYQEGTDPENEVVQQNLIEIDHLICGEWTFSATACNCDGEELMSGSTVVKLSEEAQSVEIVMEPVAGKGNLSVLIDWDQINYPGLVPSAELENLDGELVNMMEFNQDETGFTTHCTDISSGFYILKTRLSNTEEVVSFRNDVIRILSGLETMADLFLLVNPQLAGLDLSLKSADLSPLDIQLSGVKDFITTNQKLDLTAVLPLPSTCCWFLNEEILSQEDTCFFEGQGRSGSYYIQLTAIAVDESLAGSTGFTTTVLDEDSYSLFVPQFEVCNGQSGTGGTVYGLDGVRDLNFLAQSGLILAAGYEQNRIVVFRVKEGVKPDFLNDFSNSYTQIADICVDTSEKYVFSAMKGTDQIRCEELILEPLSLSSSWTYGEDMINPASLCLSDSEAYLFVAAESGLYSFSVEDGCLIQQNIVVPGFEEVFMFDQVFCSGQDVFAANDSQDVIVCYHLDELTGKLSYYSVVSLAETTGLKGVYSFSESEQDLYVAGYGSDSIAHFKNIEEKWTYQESVIDSLVLNGCRDIVFSGNYLIACAGLGDCISVFEKMEDGELELREVYKDLSLYNLDNPYSCCSNLTGTIHISSHTSDDRGIMLTFSPQG